MTRFQNKTLVIKTSAFKNELQSSNMDMTRSFA